MVRVSDLLMQTHHPETMKLLSFDEATELGKKQNGAAFTMLRKRYAWIISCSNTSFRSFVGRNCTQNEMHQHSMTSKKFQVYSTAAVEET